ncbi:transposase [Streptomyces sp. HMX87]|uniref:transposase n=1 Tax=Streptomyces sp. HMX87 TaxID=3390849 RepID=UPI003A865360
MKINGRRRHLICDTVGLPLMIKVTAGDVTDRRAATDMLPALHRRFPTITKLWADSGYTATLITWALAALHLAVTVIKRSDGVSGFVVLPRRWVVERTFGWLLRSRRLARDYERRPDSSEAMILWSMTSQPVRPRLVPVVPEPLLVLRQQRPDLDQVLRLPVLPHPALPPVVVTGPTSWNSPLSNPRRSKNQTKPPPPCYGELLVASRQLREDRAGEPRSSVLT